ncbi:ATP-binding protein [candidate division KSB1 bacterium]|nr:MAG: hypothetical protein B5M50_06405 [candidate division KSB1 bacterium 4484_219]RKY86530.1 MAG: ATP-binding protein [candidate division KSB1 bacterium]RKY87697.1 MAG: ATP-binding protein [candidate division KSB1 bacterium]
MPTVRLIVPSRFEIVEELTLLIERITEQMHFDSDDRDNIVIAVTEAVSNAIIHGNRNDEEKKVQISIVTSDKKITIRVKDEGEGFDPNKLASPLEPNNILKENGRGIFILHSLMDKVKFDFSAGGTEVIMTKYKKPLQKSRKSLTLRTI